MKIEILKAEGHTFAEVTGLHWWNPRTKNTFIHAVNEFHWVNMDSGEYASGELFQKLDAALRYNTLKQLFKEAYESKTTK